MSPSSTHNPDLAPSSPAGLRRTSLTPETEVHRPIRARRLSNGLTVLIYEIHEAPVATLDVWVRTGAADEPPELSGISHFLEHMMFKGTEDFALGQIEREIENVGGVSNAGTSYDFTHYYITLPSENVERGLHMLGEMIGASTLDAGELEKERLVILEEYRRKQDNPAALLYEDVYEQLYETGPYHRMVIGSEETIRSISREAMADYYRRHYAPENMTLIVVGDVAPENVERLAEKYFGPIERPFEPLVAEPEPTRIGRGKRRHREKATGGEIYCALTCGAPGMNEPDRIVPLDLAQYILGAGRASMLYQEIKEKRRLCSTIGCYYPAHRGESVFLINATCAPGKREELSLAVRELVERLAEDGIPPEQLERARRLLVSGHLFAFEITGGASSQIGYYHTLSGGTEFLESYIERVYATTAGDVQSALAHMLKRYPWNEISVGPDFAARAAPDKLER